MTVAEAERVAGEPHALAGARHDLRPVEHVGHFGAVGARVHRDRAADRARNARQELESRKAGARRVLRNRRVERGGAGDDAVRVARRSR